MCDFSGKGFLYFGAFLVCVLGIVLRGAMQSWSRRRIVLMIFVDAAIIFILWLWFDIINK